MRVVVADDSLLVRAGIVRLLEAAGWDVTGQAEDGEQLIDLVARLHPDAVVVDIRMPPTHTDEGIRAARRIHTEHPGVGVLVLSQHVTPAYAEALLDDGSEGMGYLLKDRVADLHELDGALRRVAAGGCVLDPIVVEKLVARRHAGSDPIADLSAREREVLSLMAEGRSNAAIAARLFISEQTVEKHVQTIFAKLGLEPAGDANRRVLAVLAFLNSG